MENNLISPQSKVTVCVQQNGPVMELWATQGIVSWRRWCLFCTEHFDHLALYLLQMSEQLHLKFVTVVWISVEEELMILSFVSLAVPTLWTLHYLLLTAEKVYPMLIVQLLVSAFACVWKKWTDLDQILGLIGCWPNTDRLDYGNTLPDERKFLTPRMWPYCLS